MYLSIELIFFGVPYILRRKRILFGRMTSGALPLLKNEDISDPVNAHKNKIWAWHFEYCVNNCDEYIFVCT